jgi:hypothetical protein
MNKIWSPDVLRYVDRWACRDGTPEDAEDERRASLVDQSEAVAGAQGDVADVEKGDRGVSGNSSGVEVDEGAAQGAKR